MSKFDIWIGRFLVVASLAAVAVSVFKRDWGWAVLFTIPLANSCVLLRREMKYRAPQHHRD